MRFVQKITELTRRIVVDLLRRRNVERVVCPQCAESFAKLHLFLADDIWDEAWGDRSDALRRNVWAFCPACQTTYDFPLFKMRFVASESNEPVKEAIREATDPETEN